MAETTEPSASGKQRSGKARMSALTPDERTALAKTAAAKRWSTVTDQVVYQPEAWGDLPLGEKTVPCAVLMIGGEIIRVISERGLIKSFGGKRGGSHWLRARENEEMASLPPILSATNLRTCISEELLEGLKTRYSCRFGGRGGAVAHGLRAELYPMICEVFLKARDQKKLLPSQDELAKAADIMMRGLAHVGITALVDEVTGFQRVRPPDALVKILEAFIAKELQPYVPTFETDYYEHLFRLRGLDYRVDFVKRPQYFGWLTNDIVYRRLAPGVLKELKKVLVRDDAGRGKHKYFQRLTSNIGYPKLRSHLGAVVAVMKMSSDYHDFICKLDQHYPRYGDTLPLPFGEPLGTDSGIGL